MRQIFFVRHGKTEYRGEGFDLTPEGVEEVKRAASKIAYYYAYLYSPDEEHPQIKTFTSPAARTKASAELILSELHARSLPTAPVVEEPELRNFEIRDIGALQKILTVGVPWDDEYWVNPIFEQVDVAEPRTEVAQRSQAFLSRVLQEEGTPFTVMVTHFELITSWLPLFGFKQEIGSGEWVHLQVIGKEVLVTFQKTMRTFILSEIAHKLP